MPKWKTEKWLLADNFSGLHFDRAKARERKSRRLLSDALRKYSKWKTEKWLLADNFFGLHFDRAKARERKSRRLLSDALRKYSK